MTDLRLVYTDDAGRLVVVTPAPKARLPDENETDFVARIALKDIPAGKDFQVLQKGELPDNRRFRNCWKLDASGVSVHAESAKAQVLAEIRAQRNQLLAQSDVLKAKTDDLGTVEQKAAVANYRQALRDLPQVTAPRLTALKTEDDLHRFSPEWPAHPEGK
jgi:hypothetical protein